MLLAGLLLRMLSTFAAVCGGGLTFKEKMFMVVAWLPKATAQVNSTKHTTAKQKS